MMAETAQMHRFKKVLAMMKVEVGLTLLLELVGSAKYRSLIMVWSLSLALLR
jgi:hypothetical protein